MTGSGTRGEANVGRDELPGKMHALINGWREVWEQGDFRSRFTC